MTSQSPRHALVGWALMLGVAGTAGSTGPVGAAGAGTAGAHTSPQLLVFAAASLSDALEEVDRAFTARTGVRVNASYAASSVLAKQIEAGAPAEVFFSADRAWVEYLEARRLPTWRAGRRRSASCTGAMPWPRSECASSGCFPRTLTHPSRMCWR